MNTTQILEEVGQQPKFNGLSCRKDLLMNSKLSGKLKSALITNDRFALEELGGFNRQIICYIASPARESDMPKDGNKPSDDNQPLNDDESPYEETALLKVG
jgi:hypothetical protein